MTLVFLHSNDLWPWVPHLKQVTLEGPVDALEEAVEDTVCFMRLWVVVCLDGVHDTVGLTLGGEVDVASLEAKYDLDLEYLMSSITWRSAFDAWWTNSTMLEYGWNSTILLMG